MARVSQQREPRSSSSAGLRRPGQVAWFDHGSKPPSEARKKAAAKRTAPRRASPRRPARTWSRQVTEHSHALDLDEGVFRRAPAAFYENRAGKSLSAERRRALGRAKDQLRALFGRARRR
jgi:hypothetical protein